jgi:hypothetical protein
MSTPFIEIANAFITWVGGVEKIKLTSEADGALGRKLDDPQVAFAWNDFHRANANLFLTDARANMRKGAKNARLRQHCAGRSWEESNAQEQESGNE